MAVLSSINQFKQLETLMLSAKVEVSWLGTRYIKLQCDHSVNLKLSVSDLFAHIENLQKQAGSKLSGKEREAGNKLLTHFKKSILNQFDAEIKKNCWKRIIVAIRDFFVCFFKTIDRNLKRIQSHFNQLPSVPFFDREDNNTIIGTTLKSFLSSTSYKGLICTNRKLHHLLKGDQHVSFNVKDYRTRYNIKMGEKRSSSISFVDLLGKSNYDIGIEQFRRRIALHEDAKGLHFGNTMRCLIQGDHLVTFLSDKLCITKINGTSLSSATSLFSTIPKTAFVPPWDEDLAIDIYCSVKELTGNYFTLTFGGLLSVWSSETSKCLYALDHEQGVLLETYMKNANTLMILEGFNGNQSTNIREINLLDVASSPEAYSIDASAALPNIIVSPVFNATISELGFICSKDGFYFYSWEGAFIEISYTPTVPTHEVRMHLYKDTIIIQEFSQSDFAIRTVAMNVHTQQFCPIQFYPTVSILDVHHHYMLLHPLSVLDDHFFVFKGCKEKYRSFQSEIFLFVVDLKTGKLAVEIPLGKWPYHPYYITNKGDLVVESEPAESSKVTIYEGLTGKLLMETLVTGGLTSTNETLLVYYSMATKTATFIDLVTHRVLATISTEHPERFSFSNGKMLTVDREKELMKIDDYAPQ